jgi:hypothetical protein
MRVRFDWATATAVAFAVFLAPVARASEERSVAAPPGVAALDQAFRFASAIRSDPKDRALSQEAVIRAYVAAGALDAGAARAGEVSGWRQGLGRARACARRSGPS